jgi:catechol 2,3-dioxygenase-like lactoylglutathione lyase family enzyme
MSKVTGLRSITLSTPKLKQSSAFYERAFGLFPLISDEKSTLFRGTGNKHHVLELELDDDSYLKKISYLVDTEKDVDDLADSLVSNDIELSSPPQALSGPDQGYGFFTKDPDGHIVEIGCNYIEHAVIEDKPGFPVQISHLLLTSPNKEEMLHYYKEILGFRINDWYENNAIIFLGCDNKHHRLVLADGEKPGIHHIAYDVKDAEALMYSIGRMRKAGSAPLWGPGRHGPGQNTFCYFADPNGYVVEFSSGLAEIDENWHAQEYMRTTENADVWGSAGPPSQEIKDLWAGNRENFSLSPSFTEEPEYWAI